MNLKDCEIYVRSAAIGSHFWFKDASVLAKATYDTGETFIGRFEPIDTGIELAEGNFRFIDLDKKEIAIDICKLVDLRQVHPETKQEVRNEEFDYFIQLTKED